MRFAKRAFAALSVLVARRPSAEVVAIGVAVALLVGAVDVATGYQMAFSSFYLLPISAVAWFATRRGALLLALLSVATWVAADLLAGARYDTWWIPWWNASVRFSVFATV